MTAPRTTTAKKAKGGRVTSPPVWHTAMMDAMAMAVRGYAPERAMEVVALMEWLPDTHAGIAELFTVLGTRSVDMVELPPSTQEFFLKLGAQQKQQHGALVTAMGACLASVRDRIDRITAGRAKDAAWDVSKHADGRY